MRRKVTQDPSKLEPLETLFPQGQPSPNTTPLFSGQLSLMRPPPPRCLLPPGQLPLLASHPPWLFFSLPGLRSEPAARSPLCISAPPPSQAQMYSSSAAASEGEGVQSGPAGPPGHCAWQVSASQWGDTSAHLTDGLRRPRPRWSPLLLSPVRAASSSALPSPHTAFCWSTFAKPECSL